MICLRLPITRPTAARHRLRCGVVVLPLLVTALVLDSVSMAAAPRNRSNRSATAAAAARKKQMIQSIQNQVSAARQVLTAAESQTTMSQSQLSAAIARIEEAKQSIGEADSSGDSSMATLRGIEERLLDAVEPDSELGRAEAAVENAHELLDRELHRILTLPLHDGKLTAEDRESDRQLLSKSDRDSLRSDAEYQQALRDLGAAKQQYSRLRMDFFKRDSEWVAVSQSCREAARDEDKARQQATTAARQALPARREARNAQEVAEVARLTIAQGEALLRQLGVKNVGSASKSKR